jgi:hypothetical protein
MEDLLAGAVERTVAAGTARLTLETRYDFTGTHPLLRRRGGLVGDALRRALGPGASVVARSGAIDFAGGRCALAGPRHSSVVVGDREWTGRPGRPVASAKARDAHAATPLWIFDLCRGVVAAEEREAVTVDGARCRRFGAEADLTEVSTTVPYEVAVPSFAESVEALMRVPIDVLVDGEGRIRRVATDVTPLGVEGVLDLYDFGVPLPSAYWDRFP